MKISPKSIPPLQYWKLLGPSSTLLWNKSFHFFFFKEKNYVIELDDKVINSRSFSSFKKILKMKLN